MRDLDECTRRRLAVQAECDPRTIGKVARGEHVRGLAGHRARAVLKAAGLLPEDSSRPREATPSTIPEPPTGT